MKDEKKAIELINENNYIINIDSLMAIFDQMKNDYIFQKEDTITLILTASDDMSKLNAKYRGINKPTDVLAFPCQFSCTPFKGDIIINVELANEQIGIHTLDMEIALLFCHGLLHLAGMDHITKNDARQMRHFEMKYTLYINSLNL
jgi:probable rRNA maturation factor